MFRVKNSVFRMKSDYIGGFKIGMNRFEFYSNLNKFNSLEHATTNYGKQHYAKIEKYYPDGRTRYFWSKDEWDAYQREEEGKAQDKFKKEQAQKKVAESRSGMSDYNSWKKKQEEQEEYNKQKKVAENRSGMSDYNSWKKKQEEDREREEYRKEEKIKKHIEEAKINKYKDLKNKNNSKNTSFKTTADIAREETNKNYENKLKEENREKLYKYKDEIVEKANEYLETVSEQVNSFLDNSMNEFPPELKDKVSDAIDKVKDSVENIIEKIDNVSEEEIANIYGFLDKIVDKVQDEIGKYSSELNEMYQKVKDKVPPAFKDEDGNIDWKRYLAITAGIAALAFIIQNPELCVETLGKIYDTGKRAFIFANEKTNGKFSEALLKIGQKLENYWVYKRLEKQGYGTFYIEDDNGNKVTFLDHAYNNWLKASGQK